MNSRLRFAALAATTLVAGACATAPLTLNDDTIVRGERIGDVEIGMTLAQLLALKGTPMQTIPIRGTAATTYAFDGLIVAAHDEVYWIIATDPRFRTSLGLTVGAEQIFARGAYGEPDCVATSATTTTYDYGDFYFEVDNESGKVSQIGVQRETQTCRS